MIFFGALALAVVSQAAEAPSVNRLAGEPSRYLQQHASNPVDWYPWGAEAFERARTENKLVFLSIGYSTCHWCHVMEQESFASTGFAVMLRPHFIAIKVDREQRPDVDSTYMAAARVLLDEAGWPLNLVLTPDGEPVFAATYLPRPRIEAVLRTLAEAWQQRPGEMRATAAMIAESLRRPPPLPESSFDGQAAIDDAFRRLSSRFDSVHGGFLPAPKFPAPHQLMFLLRYWRRSGNAAALSMVETTLRRIRRSVLFDQVGFGIHRYAEDAEWTSPHYEKMLEDQALFALVCLETHQATGRTEYAVMAREVFTYVLRDLRAADGTFFTAEDADSAGREGAFYRWSPAEIREATGRSEPIEALSPASRMKLYEARRLRARPARDESILTDRNGAMIAALAAGGAVLRDPSYTTAAARAADAILRKLRTGDGRLLHQHGVAGFLDDSAYLVWGLLNLYEAGGEIRYLHEAIALTDDALRRFRSEDGRFHLTASGGERLLIRPREIADAAKPAANSVQLLNLVRLARITSRKDYDAAAHAVISTTSAENPTDAAHFLSGVDFVLGPSLEIVLAGHGAGALRDALFEMFVPNKVVLYRPDGMAAITKIAPFTTVQQPIRGRPTAYVCTNQVCRMPTTDAGVLRETLRPRP